MLYPELFRNFESVRWSLERFRAGSPPAVFAAAPPVSVRTATG
mgnify:CR=1 FL=1